jgi:LacI family transcriptional regulator
VFSVNLVRNDFLIGYEQGYVIMKKVSLKDIAQKVGVSTALVSYVLNNKKEGRISKEAARKIKEAAKELNYSANQIARSLKTNKTFTIGLIVSDISNPFSSTLARIIEDAAEKCNYVVLFGSSDECSDRSRKLIQVLLNHQVDGFIIAPAEDANDQIQYLQEREIPFVLIDRFFPELETNYVAIDNYKASFTATKHVIENGFKRVGMVTLDTTLFNMQERKRGYLDALKEGNILIDDQWIKKIGRNNIQETVNKAINELLSLKEPIDAILFTNNVISTSGLKYINSLDIKVPDDLAIVSFDESVAADLFYAPVTHIRQPLQEIGQLATEILLDNIEKMKEIRQVNIDAEFVVRASTRKKNRS